MKFDRLAPHYRWMEWVLAGERLQTCRVCYLDQVLDAHSILLAGEGNGRFLRACRRRIPKARITCLDASHGMLQQAERRLLQGGFSLEAVDFVNADALLWKGPADSFDLIVTHFFLDCFRPDQLRQVVANLARTARPQARWLLADFCIPASGPGRTRARIIHGLMYGFFRAFARLPARHLTPPESFLETANFTLLHRQVSEWGLLHSDIWAHKESQWSHK